MNKTYHNPSKIIKITVRKEQYSGIKFYKGLSILWGYIVLIKPGFFRDGFRHSDLEKQIPHYYFIKECDGVKYIFDKNSVRVYYEGSHYQNFYFDTYEEAMKKAEEIKMISGIKIWIED